jgi:hypothetical protein
VTSVQNLKKSKTNPPYFSLLDTALLLTGYCTSPYWILYFSLLGYCTSPYWILYFSLLGYCTSPYWILYFSLLGYCTSPYWILYCFQRRNQ